MNRRTFLRVTATSAAAGQVMQASAWNELVQRVNLLSQL